MKKVMILTLILGIISIVLMILSFLASTDIYHDYIGTRIISDGVISNSDDLLEWTNCKSEWRLLQIDYFIRVVFMILCTVVLGKMVRNYKQKASN